MSIITNTLFFIFYLLNCHEQINTDLTITNTFIHFCILNYHDTNKYWFKLGVPTLSTLVWQSAVLPTRSDDPVQIVKIQPLASTIILPENKHKTHDGDKTILWSKDWIAIIYYFKCKQWDWIAIIYYFKCKQWSRNPLKQRLDCNNTDYFKHKQCPHNPLKQRLDWNNILLQMQTILIVVWVDTQCFNTVFPLSFWLGMNSHDLLSLKGSSGCGGGRHYKKGVGVGGGWWRGKNYKNMFEQK